jgi:hypothetical protein
MRSLSGRARLLALVLTGLTWSLPAQAVEFLCGDICQCWVGCTRRCTDDSSGFSTTCGAAGYACNGQCAQALDALALGSQVRETAAPGVSPGPRCGASPVASVEILPAPER